jgi:inosose dehydratase
VRERLARHGLEMVGAFLPQHFSRADRVDEDREWLVRHLEALRVSAGPDARTFAVLAEALDEPVRLAWAGRTQSNPDARLSEGRWATLVDNLHAAAELCRDRDLEPVFHPHAGTYIETADEIEQLAERMDPELVGLCLDTGHFCFGGADPAASIRAFAPLVRHVHVKDCRVAVRDAVAARGGPLDEAVGGGVFCPLGAGDAGIEESLAALQDVGYSGWIVVEQDQLLTSEDTPASVVAGQRANREYLRERGL